jgi:hypothetical protein
MPRILSGGGPFSTGVQRVAGRPGFKTMKRIKRVLSARSLKKNDPADGWNQASGRIPILRKMTKATRTIGAGNAAVLYTSNKGGLGGNAVRTAHVVAGTNTVFSIVVSGNDVTVNAATDGAGLSTTTALAAKDAVNAHAAASKLVTASLPGTGASVITASALTALTGGAVGDVRSRTEPEFTDAPPSPGVAGHEESLPRRKAPIQRSTAAKYGNRRIEKR